MQENGSRDHHAIMTRQHQEAGIAFNRLPVNLKEANRLWVATALSGLTKERVECLHAFQPLRYLDLDSTFFGLLTAPRAELLHLADHFGIVTVNSDFVPEELRGGFAGKELRRPRNSRYRQLRGKLRQSKAEQAAE
jgi:hypothetical protein